MFWALIGILLAIIVIILYNNITYYKNLVIENKWSIDTVLQQRYDLIPNLVSVVKWYAKHEQQLLENVAILRASWMNQQELSKEKINNENQISNWLKSIFALSEAYPDLKANENFMKLQEELVEIEERIQAARRSYNAAVKELKDKKEMFPTNIIANMMNLGEHNMFEASQESRENVSTKF